MHSSRRDFLQRSAAAAAAVTLGPLTPRAGDPGAALIASALTTTEDPKVRAFEEKMLRSRPVPLANVRLLGGPLQRAQELTAKYLLEPRARSHDGVLPRSRRPSAEGRTI